MASTLSKNMRIWHRYLGYFLAGIMAIYSISGVVLIFRNTDFLKSEKIVRKQLNAGLNATALGQELKMRELKIEKDSGNVKIFKNGTYNILTGEAVYKVKSLPFVLEKLARLHKANAGQPLFFLNVFFGLSLLFFVVSSFWMFMPRTTIFKKGIYFALAGLMLTLVLLFV